MTALFTTKFYLLFGFLFGYSFMFQEAAAKRDGTPFAWLHARRLLGLFLLGLAHAALLYPGDILMTYAFLGLILFTARRLSPRAALWTAAALLVFLTAVLLIAGILALETDNAGHVLTETAEAQRTAQYRGDSLMVIRANLASYRQALIGALLYSPHILAAMLTGFAAGRQGWLNRVDASANAPVRRRVLTAGFVVGLPGGVLTAMCTNGPFDGKYYYLGQAVDVLTAPVLAAAYATLLLALLRGGYCVRFARALTLAGRMSLTHYLLQSAVLALLFTGHGLARYGTVGPAALSCGCVALWAAQLGFTARYLADVRYGPAEAVLRRVTEGRAAYRERSIGVHVRE
ncbi:DUF418 domain-containing protein [Streptomyces sp. NPDC002755]|uniref:DUF418 domain-containing protein n=1 Tax=Streptomyces sp. NPDC002884 TaxID=3154544 RepID=UPI003318CAA3